MLKSLRLVCVVLASLCIPAVRVPNGIGGQSLDDVAFNRRWAASDQLPFSFVYGGRPSSELINKWKRTVEERPLDAARLQRVVTLDDSDTRLQIRAVSTVYLDTPGIDWTLYLTNRGDKDTPIIEQLRAVDVTLARRGPVTLHRLLGSLCHVDDWLPLSDALPEGKRVDIAPVGGRSSGECPFFNLQWADGGVITAIGWSGQWNASVEHAAGDRLRIQAGMQYMHLKLHPGETIRSPRIMQLHWSGNDPWRGYNLFRRTMFAHVMPRVDGKLVTPPITHLSTSFYECNASTEANVLTHLKSIEGLGFEVFWVDAYWTGGGFPNGMGNYGFPLERAEPQDRFPRGLRVIGDAVQSTGMKYLMWFEPERVAPNTHLAKEHPEWVISPSGNGSGLLNLGISAAREYLTKYFIEAIKQYKIGWLRFDYNLNPLPYWQFLNQQSPDRVGMAEIRYMEGLYRMWDDIRAAHPHLAIDNCASGGQRIDLETCTRSIPLWRTDATIAPLMKKNFDQAALQNQAMTAGLSRYVPFSVSGQMGATPYLFRSGFNAGIAFCEDCRPADYPRNLLRQAIAEGKRIRKYYFGNYYPLSPVTVRPEDWCAMQYHRPQEQDGMIMAFRRQGSPQAELPVPLREIDPTADYEITYAYSYEPSKPVRIKGSELAALKLKIVQRPGSVVIEYKKLRP